MNNPAYPSSVQIIDVCMRDGLQNLANFVPMENKTRLVDMLVAAGSRALEVTSFVSPKAIPQMADSSAVAEYLVKQYPQVRAIALVPNLRGAENAVKSGITEVTYVFSASEEHNKANVNRTIEESLEGLADIRKNLPDLKVRLSLATSFVCPFLGVIEANHVLDLVAQAIDLGVGQVILCDTIGKANPRQVATLAEATLKKWSHFPFGMHLHNTWGMGLANTLAGMQAGIDVFETAAGGLGGCPFAPGASGNTATEDTVNMLEGMGISTGIDLNLVLDAVEYIRGNISTNITGSVSKACQASAQRK